MCFFCSLSFSLPSCHHFGLDVHCLLKDNLKMLSLIFLSFLYWFVSCDFPNIHTRTENPRKTIHDLTPSTFAAPSLPSPLGMCLGHPGSFSVHWLCHMPSRQKLYAFMPSLSCRIRPSPLSKTVRFSSKATLSLNFHLSLPAKSSFPLPHS